MHQALLPVPGRKPASERQMFSKLEAELVFCRLSVSGAVRQPELEPCSSERTHGSCVSGGHGDGLRLDRT